MLSMQILSTNKTGSGTASNRFSETVTRQKAYLCALIKQPGIAP